ncbi:MAG: aminopeptidase P N-terminal domain-containing protein [Bdellovibrionales bacterium]|nr:aminopeptidase P N-terminal domain-containing protein [Bdellovibrionales bacterium]
MRTPTMDMKVIAERRKRLAQLIPGSALILTAHPEYIRNHDVHHPYRQDSNFYYLTGFEEPESIFLFRPGKNPESVLFVRNKDVERETWDGFRYGPEATKQEFQVDAAYSIDKFDELAPKLLEEVDKLYYRFFYFKDYDAILEKALLHTKSLRRRSGMGTLTIADSYQLIGEMRLIKDDFEVEQMRKAAEINTFAHTQIMKKISPGINERELHGKFIAAIMAQGAEREAYNGIFASGNNATTLHYVFNDQVCQDGDLFLIDAGPEYNFYASDVTRAYPVNGKFNEDQKRVYNRVLQIQKRMIERVKPGVTMSDLQHETISLLVDVMLDEGLLAGAKDQLIMNNEYLKYYPHGIGHWLGMDVHDAGLTIVGGEPRPLVKGMVITIEPGLYIPASDTKAPVALRGMGIRIEDNLLLTEDGHEVLSEQIPKEVSELESFLNS